MKRLYTFYPKFNKDDEVIWQVHESTTDQIVAEFGFEDDAHEYCHFLENGGAFAGFTPSFILHKMPIKDINAAFEAEFSA